MDLGQLTRDRIAALAPQAVFVLPVGAVEQHGPHMPVATDIILSAEICREAAGAAAPEATVLVAPAQPYGISNHHKPHAGVFSLTADLFSELLMTLLTCAFESGFRRAAIINGHNGNDEAIRTVAREINNRIPITIAASSYWTAAWSQLERDGVIDSVARIPGHAGTFETALMLDSHPDFVQTACIPEKLSAPKNARPVVGPAIFGSRTNYGYGPGYSDDPKAATAEFGRTVRNACVQGLTELFVKLSRMTVQE